MGRLLLGIVATVLIIIVGGTIYLMLADVPAPVATIEQIVPDDRLAAN